MDITELISLVTAAQKDLRSTTQNWGEDCLFACDDKLTGALMGLETLRAANNALRAALETYADWNNWQRLDASTGAVIFRNPEQDSTKNGYDLAVSALDGKTEAIDEAAVLRARVAELEMQIVGIRLFADHVVSRTVCLSYPNDDDTCDRQGCDAPATEYRLLRAGAVHLCAECAAEVAN
jgi:hypothetical protein